MSQQRGHEAHHPRTGESPAAGDTHGYGPPPPVRSAYPGPEEAGFHSEPVEPPGAHASPGPGYGPAPPAAAAGTREASEDHTVADFWSAASAQTPAEAGGAGPGSATRPTQREPAEGESSQIAVGAVLAVVLGGITLLGFALLPAVATVAVLVVIAAAVVLSWPAAAGLRRTVLLALAGPAGVLLGYWLVHLLR